MFPRLLLMCLIFLGQVSLPDEPGRVKAGTPLQSRRQPEDSPATVLLPSVQRPVQAPIFQYIETLCDKERNLYFHLDTGDYMSADTFRLSSDGQSGRTFKLTGDYADHHDFMFANFSVTPGGDLYVLTWHPPDRYYLFNFDSNGSMKSPTALDIPQHLTNDKFLVFEGGASLFSGFYGEKAPKNLQGKSYVALLNPAGDIRKELNTSVDNSLANVSQIGEMHDGGTATSEDGNLYILTAKNIAIFSQNGDLLKRIAYEKPDSKSVATTLYASGGLSVVGLINLKEMKITRKDFLTFDVLTGKLTGWYQTSPEVGEFDVCFSRNEGFTFIRQEKGRDIVITAPLR